MGHTTPLGVGTSEVPDQGWKLSVVDIVMTILAALIVTARWATRIASRQVGADDWLILAALVSAILYIVGLQMDVALGLGGHNKDVDPQNYALAAMWIYIADIFVSLVFPLYKTSVLMFYRRIFVSKRFKIGFWIVGFVVVSWGIASFFITMFPCQPAWVNFDSRWVGPETCINPRAFFTAYTVLDVGTDIAILGLAVPEIMQLHLETREKFMLLSVFLLGGFVVLAGIVRSVYFELINYEWRTDGFWWWIVPQIWVTVEITVGIICACLPILKGPATRLLAIVIPSLRQETSSYYYGSYQSSDKHFWRQKSLSGFDEPQMTSRSCQQGHDDEARIIASHEQASRENHEMASMRSDRDTSATSVRDLH